ncbi:MAG: YifB family Mg chelatase-like AAA ATPase [Rhodospirillaceae bacterium]|jgi:magnesium chelatase family protein|nr:YifB family Mg chelatase-like AAA ATPase [Rhodospirillaceae bacterium]MBT5036249.1 YifB family Mg chelatase-like AAA ATPase [Rhodospirillaceae bacterium]MBT6221617.1 YifB family Mg chelatase-like AAA ATPase [Rhodospirillaceae bacterium]MBT6364517.1 YifB family Mg chelatase-like AAA ATPase [Rhodospirillaceae bacterium]MBT7768345.1 YifB family Mg chelatase-like AAA ATPase [Rhodospirillales bacterium]
MVARVNTVAFQGIDVLDVDVQVQMSSGIPNFQVVGLPDKAVAESRERVRAALSAMGLALPPKRITVNLSPADVLKEGSHFDLPIALGLLATMDVLPADEIREFTALGELALDGLLAPVAGVLPAAIHANSKDRGLICPAAQGGEAAWAGDVRILAPTNLLALINHFKGTQVLHVPTPSIRDTAPRYPDLADIKGQESAKRALEIAAAGGHNMLMVGPPGAGKSMLAQRLPGILPSLDARETLEVSMIRSLSGGLSETGPTPHRPFRDPHHSASMPSLVGGGLRAKPGEVSLAHLGVLFLDELPEFQRAALEALRQPMETGQTTVARANAHVTYPARFQLIAAMNPCRCGYLDDPAQACTRAPKCAADYQAKISGPLFDRIDLHVDVPAVNPLDLSQPPPSEPSESVATRVTNARALQKDRYREFGGEKPIRTNAEADGALLEKVAAPDDEGRRLLLEAADRMRLSARGYHRVLRVARTLADLEGGGPVARIHIAEALAYRRIAPGKNLVTAKF